MADYFVTLTIPENTPQTSPVFTQVEIEGDVLVGFYRLIPPGWSGLAHYRVLYGLEQLHPANEGAWDTGDNIRDFVPLNWRMPERKLKLTVEGYNQDTSYDHTVYLWFRTEEVEYARPTTLLKEIRDLLKEIFGVE
jgi:hypothetical protein